MHLIAVTATVLALTGPVEALPEAPSRAIGKPWDGRLKHGVSFPEKGDHFFTWDWPRKRSPNREWRRWGTATTVARTLTVLQEFSAAHPGAPRVGVADLSRPHGGTFDERYGGLGHASHQNGLDVDVLYPRKDARELAAIRSAQVDRALAQDLVDRFVAAGAQRIFVGWKVRLRGPRRIVVPLSHHENHFHVRFRPDGP